MSSNRLRNIAALTRQLTTIVRDLITRPIVSTIYILLCTGADRYFVSTFDVSWTLYMTHIDRDVNAQ